MLIMVAAGCVSAQARVANRCLRCSGGQKKKDVHTDAYGGGRYVALKCIIAYGCLRRMSGWVGTF